MDAATEIREKHAALITERGEISSHISALWDRKRQIDGDLLNLIGAARLFGEDLPLPADMRPPVRISRASGHPLVRDYVIAQLQSSPNGVRSSDVGRAYQESYKISLHPKTIGMTLYRLLLAGYARREGRIWFSTQGRSVRTVA